MSGPRVVFDCGVLLQALANPGGPSGRCVELVLGGTINLFLSKWVLDELRDVTARPTVARKLGLVEERVYEFLERIEIAGTVVPNVDAAFFYRRDPDDSNYINLAIAADAKLIVSRDRDLLDLMDVAKPEAADFQRRFPKLQILDPVAFLREVRVN